MLRLIGLVTVDSEGKRNNILAIIRRKTGFCAIRETVTRIGGLSKTLVVVRRY